VPERHATKFLMLIAAGAAVGLAGCTTTGLTKLWPWSSSKSNQYTATPTTPESTVSIFAKKPEASPELHVATARIYERNGNYELAADEYQAALKKTPNDVATLLSYAHLLDHQGKLADATKIYERAIKANPNEPAAYNDLGLCFARREMMKDSAKVLGKAVELQPDRPLYRNNLASVMVQQGKPDDALAQLKAVYPEAVAQYNLGVMLGEHNQDAIAEAHFQRALQTDPTMSQAQVWRERLAARNGAASRQLAAASQPGLQVASNMQTLAYQPSPSPARVSAVPAPNSVVNSYGVAPEPEAVSSYLRPELSPTIENARLASRYGAPGAYAGSAAGNAMPANINGPAMPPMPESVGTYGQVMAPDIHYLPPIN
jgi:Tfp pilus assembly protein PilF